MTDRELENRLRAALDHAAPNDLSGVLSRCESGKGTVISMTNAMENHNDFNNPNANTNPPAKKRRSWARTAVAACLALAVLCGCAVYFAGQGNALASIVCLDVNPSIELRVSEKNKVLSATAMNDDAVEILDGMDLVGTDPEVAVNAIIGSLLQHGYVDELANSILITVEDDDLQRGEALKEALTAQADAALASAQVNGAILSQTLQFSEELSRKAEEYGISAGKAALIQAVVEGSNNTKTFEDLVGLSINELNLLYAAQAPIGVPIAGTETTPPSAAQESTETIASSGSASQSAYIGQQAAQEAALKHAGLTAAQVTFLESEYDYDDGRMIYEVEFHYNGTEYDYEIDAATGEIVKYQKEANGYGGNGNGYGGGNNTMNSNTGSYIGESAAKTAALNHAGVKESDTSYCAAWLEYDDGRAECYEVEFMAGKTRYEYKIALTSATVLEAESETYGGTSGGSAGTGTGSTTDIGSAKAKSIALDHAGVSESQTRKLEVKRDYDDGRLEYEVEFHAAGVEYEYTIDAATGTILDYEIDH